jgi:rhamnose utilization protein RhaD (predicted bifunctional aldolase and dehydrogenase)
MDARWDDALAREFCARYAQRDPDLAQRIYSARLLAAHEHLGAPGMASSAVQLAAAEAALLWISPRGADLASLEPEQLAAFDLGALRARGLEPAATHPNPDAVLHAAVPARFSDLTQPAAVLALACQPDAELRVRALLGARVGWIGWADSPRAAARAVAEACEKYPELEGIVLRGRGLLTFGDSARESVEGALGIAARAEALVQERLGGGRWLDARPVVAMREAGEIAHVLRGALAAPTGALDRPFVHVVLDFRSSDDVAHFASAPLTPLLAAAPPPSLAHARPSGSSLLFVPAPPYADAHKLRGVLRREVEASRLAWIAAVERVGAGDAAEIGPLDPTPRAVLLPGIGLFGVGETRARARAAAAAAEHAIRVKLRAATLGHYEGLSEAAALQAAFAGRSAGEPPPLCGQIALVAGATARGAELARALRAAGAELLLVDRDPAGFAPDLAGEERVSADPADALDVRDALRAAAERLGGLDVLALDVDVLGPAAGELVDQALGLLAAQGTGGSVLLAASAADVTELCQRAALQGAAAHVRVRIAAPGAPIADLVSGSGGG